MQLVKSKLINKTLYRYERKTLINMLIWGIVAAAFIVLTMSLYPTINKAMQDAPAELKNLLGGFDNIHSYFEQQVGLFWVFIVCVYGAYLATKLVTKELKNSSTELIYTMPISRAEIVRTKALRVFINITLINVICAAAGLISLVIWGKGIHYGNFVIFTLFAWVVTLVVTYFIFGLALACRRKFSLIASLLIVMVFYIIAPYATDSLSWVAYFSPMSIMDGSILSNGFAGVPLYGVPLAIWVGVILLVNLWGLFKFNNADLCKQ